MVQKHYSFFISLLLLLVSGMLQAQNTVTNDAIKVSDLTYDGDIDAYYFVVSIEGEKDGQNYTAYNMDITLPQGITLCSEQVDDETIYWVDMCEDQSFYPYTSKMGKVTYSHTFSCNLLNGNMLRVACISNTLATFKQKDGDLFWAYVNVDKKHFKQSFTPKPTVKVSGVRIADNQAKGYQINDFECRPFLTGLENRELPFNVSAANQVGTLIVPFSCTLPEGVSAYSCNSVDEEKRELVLAPAASLEACKPYIVYAPQGFSGTLSGTVAEGEYPMDDVYAEGYLTGVLTPTVVNQGYIMQNKGEGPKFYNAEGANFSLNAGKCYFTPTMELLAMTFSFNFDRITGISIVPDNGTTPSVVFDLTGRPVAHPQRGIYISNGKKVLVK
jgi:hypothetical protein